MKILIPCMKHKLLAFLIHSSSSLIVALCALLIVFYLWYPDPLQLAMGVTDLFFMLLAIDVILGPVITLIIYKPGKKHLLLDLCIIVLVQIMALSYGMYTIYQGRPAFVVFSKDRFETVSLADIDLESAKTARNHGNQHANEHWLKPRWVAATPSLDDDRRQEILLASAFGGADWPQLPELYTSLSDVKPQILEKAKPLDKLLKLHENNLEVKKKIESFAEKDIKWLPLLGKAKNMTVLIDADSAEVIKIVDIAPWP